MFETRLGLRMDYEACLAYLLLPPAGGVLLLILEHRSDYVRSVCFWVQVSGDEMGSPRKGGAMLNPQGSWVGCITRCEHMADI